MFKRLLIANRGEIAIRIMRTAVNLGITTVAVYSKDDKDSLHAYRADESIQLDGEGAAAYLDIDGVIDAALRAKCDAIHPGYGFLSENAAFAKQCQQANITFIGPSHEALALFGDKGAARQLAIETDIPVLDGTSQATTLEEAKTFFKQLGKGNAMIIKALAGGGGRGVRIITDAADLDDAFERCAHEAQAAFGNGSLYVEQFMPNARHIEVQVLGDMNGNVIQLGERDCSIQRRHQKIIEIAPAPDLAADLKAEIHAAAVALSTAAGYTGAGTIEFLVDPAHNKFAFIEANARLQVEHTITEQITGIDLVAAQLHIACGSTIDAIIKEPVVPRGYAIQLRINMETMLKNGFAKPSGGTIKKFNPPSGPDIRLDTYAYPGYSTNPRFDSLLAKLIVHSRIGEFEDAIASAYRALCEFQIEGVSTNISFLQNLLSNPDVQQAKFYTRFVDDHIQALVEDFHHNKHYLDSSDESVGARQAGAKLDTNDPLAVL
ncbi:MAG: biotin carboxylase N-terminal domain-containing protein, partial [Pseudomonadales bacterium]